MYGVYISPSQVILELVPSTVIFRTVQLLTQKLLQGYVAPKLKSSLQLFYGCHHDLVDQTLDRTCVHIISFVVYIVYWNNTLRVQHRHPRIVQQQVTRILSWHHVDIKLNTHYIWLLDSHQRQWCLRSIKSVGITLYMNEIFCNAIHLWNVILLMFLFVVICLHFLQIYLFWS